MTAAADDFRHHDHGSSIPMPDIPVVSPVRRNRRLEREQPASRDLRAEVEARDNDSMQQAIGAVDVWQANCGHSHNAASGRLVTQWPHTIDEFAARTVRPDESVYEADRAVEAQA